MKNPCKTTENSNHPVGRTVYRWGVFKLSIFNPKRYKKKQSPDLYFEKIEIQIFWLGSSAWTLGFIPDLEPVCRAVKQKNKPNQNHDSQSDLFIPTHLAYFLCFLGSKLRTTNHNYKTTPLRCPDF